MKTLSLGRCRIMIVLLLASSSCTPTQEQIEQSSQDEAKQALVDKGIEFDLDAYKYHVARGEMDETKLFLQAGMNVDETLGGETALSMICGSGSIEMIRLLLENGADPNGKSTTSSIPIVNAALANSLDIAEILLDAGADPNAAFDEPNFGEDGKRTALMLAAHRGHSEMTKLLLKHGARAGTLNEPGETALSLAEDSGHTEIVALLAATEEQTEHSTKDAASQELDDIHGDPAQASEQTEEPSDSAGPMEAVGIWNDALYDGNIEVARKHTSHTSSEYLKQLDGLEGLSKSYQKGRDNRPEKTYEKETIDGDVAHVIYTSNYKDGSIKQWEDTLFREDGVWKVAPQHVRTHDITTP